MIKEYTTYVQPLYICIVRSNYMTKKSKRLEFTGPEIKQIEKAAKLVNRSAKKFMELAVLSGTLQTILKHDN